MPFRDACKISKSSKQWNVTKCATCRQSICTIKVISLRDKSVFFRPSTCKRILQTFTYPKPLYEPSDKTTLLLDAYNAWTAKHTNWQSKKFQTTHTASSSFPKNVKVFSQAWTEQQNKLMQVNHLDTTVLAKSTKESTWPHACTPASVRPDAASCSCSREHLVALPSASSIICCTVRVPGCSCQPARRIP
jgi:hypothetical protein